MTRKPRSHVRILIYRTWAIRRLDELYQWSRRCARGAVATQAMSDLFFPNQTLTISGIINRKWNDIVLLKQRFQSRWNDSFVFRPKFWLLLSKVGLETKMSGSGTGSFGRTEPTVQEDYLWRWTILAGKFPLRPKGPIYFFDQNFRKFCYNGKHPLLFLMAERGSLSSRAFLHTVSYYKECAYRFT